MERQFKIWMNSKFLKLISSLKIRVVSEITIQSARPWELVSYLISNDSLMIRCIWRSEEMFESKDWSHQSSEDHQERISWRQRESQILLRNWYIETIRPPKYRSSLWSFPRWEALLSGHRTVHRRWTVRWNHQSNVLQRTGCSCYHKASAVGS